MWAVSQRLETRQAGRQAGKDFWKEISVRRSIYTIKAKVSILGTPLERLTSSSVKEQCFKKMRI